VTPSDLKFLTWFNVLDDSEVDVATVLICDEVLLGRVCSRTNKHHPVTLVLIMGVDVLHSSTVFLNLSSHNSSRSNSVVANSAFHPSGVDKWVPASAGNAKAGMAHSVSILYAGCAGKTVRSLENTCHTRVP